MPPIFDIVTWGDPEPPLSSKSISYTARVLGSSMSARNLLKPNTPICSHLRVPLGDGLALGWTLCWSTNLLVHFVHNLTLKNWDTVIWWGYCPMKPEIIVYLLIMYGGSYPFRAKLPLRGLCILFWWMLCAEAMMIFFGLTSEISLLPSSCLSFSNPCIKWKRGVCEGAGQRYVWDEYVEIRDFWRYTSKTCNAQLEMKR